MTTIRVRTAARKIGIKVRPGAGVRVVRVVTPVKTGRLKVKQPARFQHDHD